MKHVRVILVLLLVIAAAVGYLRFSAGERVRHRSAAPAVEAAAKPEPTPLEMAVSQVFLQRGSAFFDRGAYGAAVERFSDAIAADPTNAKIYFLRGTAYTRLQQLTEAIADFSAAIEVNGQHTYYVSRCGAYVITGEWDAAISDCSDAIRLAPLESEAYFLRSVAYYSKGDMDRALADSLTMLIIHPGDPNAKAMIDEILAQRELRERESLKPPVIKTELGKG